MHGHSPPDCRFSARKLVESDESARAMISSPASSSRLASRRFRVASALGSDDGFEAELEVELEVEFDGSF